VLTKYKKGAIIMLIEGVKIMCCGWGAFFMLKMKVFSSFVFVDYNRGDCGGGQY
jgi:hypothetical protein